MARDCVVELVEFEPTTRLLWNAIVSDQLTLSDITHSSSKRSAIDGHFYKSEIFGCRHAGMKSPRCSPYDGSLLPPRRHHHRALTTRSPSAPVEAASHNRTVVRPLSLAGVRQV